VALLRRSDGHRFERQRESSGGHDAEDQARVQAEMEQRYPVLARNGFPVSRIVLWHKKSGESLFIALLDHPEKAGESCFTATFAAARFADIDTLRRKYLRPEMQI